MHDIRGDEDVKKLVNAFYNKVREDERLGYIFDDIAKVDWEKHLPKMVNFWSNILFRTGRYKGQPFRQHLPLPIDRDDFSIWLGLFEESVDSQFSGEKAEYAKEMANKIASSFILRLSMEGKIDLNFKRHEK